MYILIILSLVRYVCSEITVLTPTPTGAIEGLIKRGKYNGQDFQVVTYLGIPYAEPPTGNLRFAKPVKKGHFKETFKANEMGSACIQLQYYVSATTSEDCLNLNIVTPRNRAGKKAVLVYIHGGWFQYGLQDVYYSPAFSAINDVIFVTLNYRLNAYGFLAHEDFGFKGNYGLWDQQLALQWVHDNIGAFGGDPNRVTIVGNSAGSASVLAHMLYPGNKGLFQNVIAESGTPIAPWALNEDYKTTFEDFVRRCGCDSLSVADTAECLRKLNTDDIKVDPTFLTLKLHLPVHDGEFITFSSSDFYMKYEENKDFFDRLSSFNLIIGLTSSDGSWNHKQWSSVVKDMGGNFAIGIMEADFKVLSKQFQQLVGVNFSQVENTAVDHQYLDWADPYNLKRNRNAFLDYSQDVEYAANVVAVASAHSRGHGRGQTFMYEFDHKPSFSDVPFYIEGALHEDELPFVFAFPPELMRHRKVDSEDPAKHVTREEVTLSNRIQHLWATFAKRSDAQNLSDLLNTWPEYTEANETYIRIQAGATTVKNFYRGNAVHFWNVLMRAIQKALSHKEVRCVTSGGPTLWPLVSLFSACFVIIKLTFYALT